MITGFRSNTMAIERRDEYRRYPKVFSQPDEGFSWKDFHT